jgi:hypothetical protein
MIEKIEKYDNKEINLICTDTGLSGKELFK